MLTSASSWQKIRIFADKGAFTSWNIMTLGDSIWVWGQSYVEPQPRSWSKIFCHFVNRGHREVEKNFFKFFSCYYIIILVIKWGENHMQWIMRTKVTDLKNFSAFNSEVKWIYSTKLYISGVINGICPLRLTKNGPKWLLNH